jgi:hypothetical protein
MKKNRTRKEDESQEWWYILVIPATQEVKTGGS